MWFTARVTEPNSWGGYGGVVVDPGNWSREGVRFQEGQRLPNLRAEYLKTIPEDPS
jgi:hypothetical protein